MSMLGFRNGPLARRTPSSSSILKTDTPPESPQKTKENPMATISNGSPAGTDSQRPTSGTMKGVQDGQTNGSIVHKTTTSSSNTTSSSTFSEVSIVSNSWKQSRHRVKSALGSEVDNGVFRDIDIDTFMEYISNERLTNMPHRGGRWDKVLKSAEYFALQLSSYQELVRKFARDSEQALHFTLGCCRLLLDLGAENAKALEASFGVFYKLGLSISFFLRNKRLHHISSKVRDELAHAYSDLTSLVGDVAVYYRKRTGELSSGSVSVDFSGLFGRKMENFNRHKTIIVDILWSHSLNKVEQSVDIAAIRSWLGPRDNTLQLIVSDGAAAKTVRAEYSCEWLQRHLLEFFRSNDHIMSIDGAAGSGKSVLSGWAEERLQRPLGRKSYETISFTFEADVPSMRTSLAFIKGLLIQLVERDAGDAHLYNHLVRAYQISYTSKTGSEVEDELWHALRTGIQTVTKSKDFNLVLIIDGLNEIAGGEPVQTRICERLNEISTKSGNARSIVFSQPLPWPPSTAKGRRVLNLKPDLVRDDIHRFVRAELEVVQQYSTLNAVEKDQILDWILDNAKASFVWAQLAWRTSKAEAIQKNDIKVVMKAPTDQISLMEKLFSSIDFTKPDVKHLFSWLLIAERPLTLVEVQDLLKIDVAKGSIETHTHGHKHIEEMCGPAVVIRNGILRFRHSTIRDFFMKKAREGKSIRLIDAHKELVLKLLLYVKLRLAKPSEPSFESLDKTTVDEVFQNHQLLEYAVRYWASHFRQSSWIDSKGGITTTVELKHVYPESTFFALLEWACWESQTSIMEAFHLHDLVLRIRQSILGDKHEDVLQSLIIVALFHDKLAQKREAGVCYYRASKIGQLVLREYSIITVQCTKLFLACVESFTFTSRTELVTFKEEMLRYIIEVHKHQHGHQSEIVIKHCKALAALYLAIHEESKAAKMYHEVYELTIKKYGKSSEQAREVSEELTVVINKDGKSEDVERYTTSIFETAEETLEVWDRKRIQLTIRQAEAFAARGKTFEAEEIYVTLWRRVTEVCRSKRTVDMHVLKIDMALSYVEFLRRHSRIEEASNILMVIWSEYGHEMHGSEVIAIRLKKIGETMKAVGLLAVAISVFTAVWGWYKKSGRIDDKEAKSTTVLISETVEEEVRRTVTKKTTTETKTTTITKVSTATVREVYEVTYERCKTSKIYTELIKATTALASLYVHEENWTLAVETITKTLELTWGTLITGEGKLSLPSEGVLESIEIAYHLALSYRKLESYEKSERIYSRIFRSCITTLKIDDERVTNAALILIRFYEDYHRHDKAISIYVELLEGYKKNLGATHKLTIRTLYALGALCVAYGMKGGYDYYQEIVTVLNKGHKHCHKEAFEAAAILCKHYREEQRWTELKAICETLWESFVHHSSEYKFSEELIITIYENYVYVLDHHSRAEYSLLYKITVQYHETVVKVFGESSTLTITAMISLAKVCERHESHHEEAIRRYEEVIKKTTTTKTTTTVTTVTVTTTVINEVRKRLSRTYIKVINSGKSKSPAIAERGIGLVKERFDELKMQYGYWHETTLTELRELMLLYRKQNTQESHAVVVRSLQSHAVEIISKETVSERLFQAAVSLAGIYLTCELPEHGFELLRMLRRQIIYKDNSGCSFSLDHEVGKISYVFLVAFEESLLRKERVSYTEIMVDLLTETFLYEQYIKVVKTDRFETTFKFGSQLRTFLVTRKRDQQIKMLDDQLFEVFLKRYGTHLKTKRETTFVFYELLLEELGRGSRHQHHIVDAACLASNNRVKSLVEAGQYRQAYEVALCAFQFLSSQGAYRHLHNIGYGFKLSLYLAGRDVHGKGENKLQKEMLELSRSVIQEVFDACREHNINFVQLTMEDLDALVGLLGEQQNYQNLETLLASLWSSRTVQKTWSRDTLIQVGRSLVIARFAHGHHDSAIHLAEDIAYNLRRTLGSLDKHTLSMYLILSQLYTGAKRYRDAMGLHEEILRLVLYGDEEDGVDADHDLGETARLHLELLKRSYQRLGEFDKSADTYRTLYEELSKQYSGKLQSVGHIDRWPKNGATDSLGTFTTPAKWEIVEKKTPEVVQKENVHQKKRPTAYERARASWGFRSLLGSGEKEETVQ